MNNQVINAVMQNNLEPYRVCLMGASLDTGNKGVSALCASLIKIMLEVRPDAKIKLFIGNRSSQPQQLKLSDKNVSLEVVNFRMSPKAQLERNLLWIFFLACLQKIMPISVLREKIIHGNSCLHELEQADLIGDIRGGDSFSDIYGLRGFVMASLPVIIVILLGKKLVLLPQTHGPFNAFWAKKIGCFIVSHAYRVCSRDLAGIDYIKELIGAQGTKNPVLFCPDVAFKLDSIKPENIDIQPSLDQKMISPLIGINVNGLMYNGGYTEKNMFSLKVDYKILVRNLIEKLLQETDARILLIPHTFGLSGSINSDPDASLKVLSLLKSKYGNRMHMVVSEHDQSGMKGVIGLCDFFIGSRMHACIAGLSQCIPTIGIAYSKKFLGVFDSIGSGNTVLDARTLDEATIIKKVLYAYQKRDELRKSIEGNITEAQRRIDSVFKKLVS